MNLSASRNGMLAGSLLLLTLVAGCYRAPTLSRNGGTVLNWQVAKTDVYGQPIELTEVDQQSLIDALEARIANVAGIAAPTIEAVADQPGVLRIELPGITDPNQLAKIKRAIAVAGRLEFTIVAQAEKHRDLMEWLNEPTHKTSPQQQLVGPADQPLGLWIKVKAGPEHTLLPALFRNGETGERLDLSDPQNSPDLDKIKNLQILTVRGERYTLGGEHLTRVTSTTELHTNRPAISFTLSDQGAVAMAKLTAAHTPDVDAGRVHYLAIVFDGEVLSAPRLQDVISKQGQITGDFTQREIEFLINVLRAGQLPARMSSEPLSQEEVEPTQ